ncbi:16S rRNA (guanine(966)-N(2))-methyltransferase RsmD [Clostridium algidicarnis]|uniref:16S rRNA (guanine(966)-N(2))-methyltransferase RsmD n=1 Tax=Clostridium algidicarnis TaxID=37659 RepID=UPI001C0E6BB6|nr:16S rRNA (guanine(966)-N(2))-methyltransferase RsmD [Clostridium algidicarnis]MBU3203210.1 16S rRNA (guanine(966)-N(2))-methyltransferase RsmD [Clostridium algidicarnis]MBU3211364.1 16S rRNA (guanine(966)-N(2))-methyltransferase RsmD [Clostridium algidicarnis]MBU3222128.1 16S rRNA (guanine(966)-N(2))-methyltransferase RsmD [Clostridium algidicarnis]
MRIIAGVARGRKLLAPVNLDTRPTLDRVKEAMFSMIQLRIPNATTLDVFAGTGSLGLESVSRGAKECYLIDKSPVTFPLLKQNVENLKFQDKAYCLNMDSYEALKRLGKSENKFDMIFIDPPYMKEMIPKAIELVHSNSLLAKGGLIVTKIDSQEEIYEGNGFIILKDHRRYGNTTICFYDYKED